MKKCINLNKSFKHFLPTLGTLETTDCFQNDAYRHKLTNNEKEVAFMIYGFISSLDDETTKVFFRSKKIRVNNIYSAGSLGELTSVLQSGDVVYTVSCNRFASVRQVYTFARFCHGLFVS